MHKILFVSACLLFIFHHVSAQQNAVIIDENKRIIYPWQGMSYYEDVDRSLNLQMVSSPSFKQNFKPFPREILNLGVSKGATWLKFDLQLKSSTKHYLFLDHVAADSIFFYTPDATGGYMRQEAGKKFLKRIGNIPLINGLLQILPLKDDKIQTCYVRMTSTRYMFVKSTIISDEEIFYYLLERYVYDFICFGIIFFAVFYNLFVYFSVRDISYLYYVIYTALIGFSLFFIKGYVALFFPNFYKLIAPYNYTVNLAYSPFVTFFTFYFLRVKKYSKLLYQLLWVCVVVECVQMLLGIIGLGFHPYLIGFNVFFSFLGTFFHIYVSIFILRKGYRTALYYLISWGIFALLTGFLVLSYNGFFPIYAFTDYITISAVALETIISSLGLAYKINVFRRKSLMAQKKNMSLVKKQNEMLEVEVQKRTERIEYQKTQLQEQKERIEEMNNNLEHLVAQRTQELKQTLDSLTMQNQDLAQFSYIASHNLRAPVARILGLLQVLEQSSHDEKLKTQLLTHIHTSAIDLDMVIRDLAEIIAIRNDLNKLKEEIDLLAVIEQQKSLLRDEIKKTKAIIDTTQIEERYLFSVKNYAQSILYNLISNAIKYKHPKRVPMIFVKTEIVENDICLSIMDNGIGIDIKNIDPYKIFGLYQRLHDHVEGKGMGLFLIKTQIESVGGSIDVESKLGEGATFKVYFPK
jgi:two-component system, sensor histidine kinase LadS